MEIRFNKEEASVLLHWYEVFSRKNSRYGSAQFIFPQEEIILYKLKKSGKKSVFDDMDVDVLSEWMDAAINPYPANQTFYFPAEQSCIEKIQDALKHKSDLTEDITPEQKENAIKVADKLLKEKQKKG